MVADIVKPANRKQTKTVNASATTTQYVYPDAGKDLTKVTVNGLTASAALGNATTNDVAEGKTFSSSNGILLTGTGAIIPNAHVYGAEWAGTSDPSWTRTDESANFSDPNPYYSGMSTTPSSPFDGLMPWAGIRRVSDTNAGELVEIPKFWYRWTKDGVKMKLQIADKYKPGFSTSPIHVDRGDGVGERDYAYVGRYVCGSNYKSSTGQTPKNYNTRSQFVSGIHSLGSYVYIWDWLTYCTICMLYLVEYATFNSQAVIGYGCSVNNSRMSTGYTDSLPYHTGTTQSSRASYGGTQYRYIEGIWDNIGQYFGGVNTPNSNEFWIEKNPNSFADGSSVGIKLGSISYGYNSLGRNLKLFNYPGLEGLFWFEDYVDYDSTSGASNMYTCDSQGGYGQQAPRTGTGYEQGQSRGLFCTYANYWNGAYSSDPNIGSRLMVLPSSRLSA